VTVPVTVIAMPFHNAVPETGMGAGPRRLLEQARLAEALGPDTGVDWIELVDGAEPEIARTFELNSWLATAVARAARNGRFPLVLSGNCNSCLGVTAGVPATDLGVVWFDAHADFDTPEDNVSGFLDVMALSTLTGSCWEALRSSIPGFAPVAERDVILVGARDLHEYQWRRLGASDVRRIATSDLDGSLGALGAALDQLGDGKAIYLHVDLDVLDPSVGRANEYAAKSGLTLDRLLESIAAIRDRREIAAATISAYDPACDDDGRIAAAAVEVARAIAG
jgi:arginase